MECSPNCSQCPPSSTVELNWEKDGGTKSPSLDICQLVLEGRWGKKGEKGKMGQDVLNSQSSSLKWRWEGYSSKKNSKNKKKPLALTHVTQLVGHHPAKQRVTGSLPSQGTCLCCGFSPCWGFGPCWGDSLLGWGFSPGCGFGPCWGFSPQLGACAR